MHNVDHNFNNMTDKNKFLYLMKYHWKEASVYLEKKHEVNEQISYISIHKLK